MIVQGKSSSMPGSDWSSLSRFVSDCIVKGAPYAGRCTRKAHMVRLISNHVWRRLLTFPHLASKPSEQSSISHESGQVSGLSEEKSRD